MILVAGVLLLNSNKPELIAFSVFEITKDQKLKKGIFRIPMYYARNMPQNPIKHCREQQNHNMDRIPAYFTLVEISSGDKDPVIFDQIDPKNLKNMNFKLTESEPNLIKYYKGRIPPDTLIMPQEIENFTFSALPSFQIANESVFCKKKINDGFYFHLDFLVDLPKPFRYITCIHFI